MYRRFVAPLPLLFTLLLLQGCGERRVVEREHTVRNARNATVFVTIVTRVLASIPRSTRPGAILGLHMGSYLSTGNAPLVQAALGGVGAIFPMSQPPQGEQPETFRILQELGVILQKDLKDALNRSQNRAQTLGSYIEELQHAAQGAKQHLTVIQEERQKIQEDRRAKEKTAHTLERTVNDALRNGNYAAAGATQEALTQAKGELGRAEAALEQLESVIATFEELLEIASIRLSAVDENREALVTGVKVVEIPGIEHLGLLERRSRAQQKEKGKTEGGLLDFSTL